MKILSKLARKQVVIMPTLLGWLLILVSSTAILYYAFTNSHQYLSKNEPFNGGVLVIEGSLPDYVIESSINAFDQLNCDKNNNHRRAGTFRFLSSKIQLLFRGRKRKTNQVWIRFFKFNCSKQPSCTKR